ncbi:MAG: molybdate ABC transporter permease subunit [Planctomycetota bacterium]
MPSAWPAVRLTLLLAATSTVALLLLGTPMAWWLGRGRSRLRALVEALVALPLVLPPTVLGFYLLVLLGPQGALGRPWEALGGPRLVFSFAGLVVGSVIYSLPFVVQPLVASFRGLDPALLEAAATLGASPLDRFRTVVLPLTRAGFLTAATLGFAHTVGEFGVVLMIGGSVPERTRVLSIAIFEHVEQLEYGRAHLLAGGMLAFAFLALLVVQVAGARQGPAQAEPAR